MTLFLLSCAKPLANLVGVLAVGVFVSVDSIEPNAIEAPQLEAEPQEKKEP